MIFKRILKVFLWFIFGLIALIASGSICLYVFQDSIKKLAIEKINDQINTKISVDEIDLSFIKHFPFASINFPNIRVQESFKGSDKNLIEAKEISLAFNIWNIIDKEYVIQKVFIKNGKIHLRVDSNNVSNFQIFKSNQDSSSTFNLDLEVIELMNMEIVYDDKYTPQYYSIFTENSVINGHFNESVFDLNFKSTFFVDQIQYDGFIYLQNKNCTSELSLKINKSNSKYSIQNAKVFIEKIAFGLDGYIQNKEEGVYSDLKISAEHLDLSKLMNIIPVSYSNLFANFNFDGEGKIILNVKGLYSDNSFPSLISKGSIKLDELESKMPQLKGKKFENLSFDYLFSNGIFHNKASSQIQFNNIATHFQNESLNGKLAIQNFEDPYIDLALKGAIGLNQLLPFLNQPILKTLTGKMVMDVFIKGKLESFKEIDGMNNINAFGSIDIIDGGALLNNNSLNFNKVNGSFKFDKIDLVFNDLSAKVSNSDFLIRGKILNIFPYILKKNQNIEITANVSSKNVDLDELLQATGSSGEKDSLYRFKINPRIAFKITADCEKVNFQKFKASKLSTQFSIENQVMRSDYISMNTMDGSLVGKLSVDASLDKDLFLNADVNLEKINLRKLFYCFGNFNQDYIVDNNLKGLLSANISLSSMWTNSFTFIPDKFYTKCTILIENGELINFKPLDALAKYVNLDDLRNLKFQTLQNEIEIKDQVVNIPNMEIKNNALNVSLYGIHSFENTFDYHLKIKLSELLSQKRKNKITAVDEFGPIEEDEKGGTTLFLRMYGTSENTQFSVDKAAIKQKLSTDISQEGKEVKRILKEEFNSIFKKGSASPQIEDVPKNSWENDIPKSGNSPKPINKASEKPIEKKATKSTFQQIKDKLLEKEDEAD